MATVQLVTLLLLVHYLLPLVDYFLLQEVQLEEILVVEKLVELEQIMVQEEVQEIQLLMVLLVQVVQGAHLSLRPFLMVIPAV
jgi:hypothetical protein